MVTRECRTCSRLHSSRQPSFCSLGSRVGSCILFGTNLSFLVQYTSVFVATASFPRNVFLPLRGIFGLRQRGDDVMEFACFLRGVALACMKEKMFHETVWARVFGTARRYLSCYCCLPVSLWRDTGPDARSYVD